MDASLLWPIATVIIAILGYRIADRHLSTRTLSDDVQSKLRDLESRINEVSLRTFGRK